MGNILSTNLVIIGNTAYDTKEYILRNMVREKDVGGACLYSALPASIFYKVGIVTKIGRDFNLNEINKYDLDLDGVKREDIETTHFYTKFFSEDGQDATTYGDINDKMIISYEDIPKKYLSAKHIHFTTGNPEHLLDLIEKIKKNSSALISVDTIKGFADLEKTKEIFDMADIAFIDKEFKNLLNCKAKIKIYKLGKGGCIYKDQNKTFYKKVNVKEKVVDKLGAGDCLNGVFINLLANGWSEEKALEKAIEVATMSIDDFGILNLKDNVRNKNENEKER